MQVDKEAWKLTSGAGYGDSIAWTWDDTVYIAPPPNGLRYDGSSETCVRENADTVAHELWHVVQFRQTGSEAAWAWRWVRERAQYGERNMPIENEAIAHASAFTSSPVYRQLWALRCGAGLR